MTRRCTVSLVLAFSLLFPMRLLSQSSDSRAGAASPARSTSGCTAFPIAQDGGGSSAADTRSAAHGFDLANLNRSFSPCDDFYQFADGGWLKSNPVPRAWPSWASFNKLQDHNQQALHDILEQAAKDPSAQPGSNWQKIGDFYASCMDETQIESAGLKPLNLLFQQISDIKDTAALEEEIARLQHAGVNAVFQFGSEQDLKDSTQVIAAAAQGGLDLPDRQYYLDDDDHSKRLRAEYLQHVTNMFKLLGDSDEKAAAEAKTVLEVETTLAKASKKREDLRDPDANYHPMSLPQLDALSPHLSWKNYFSDVGVPSLQKLDVGQIQFFKQMDESIASVSLDDWKTYLRWHLIHSVASALPKKFVDENFAFYGRELTGSKELLPRWQRCVESADRELGEALGQYYVLRYFPPEAKARALEMVKSIMGALQEDLQTLDWMSPATRGQALKKLSMMSLKIGYPDKWRDYSKYKVDRGPYVENVIRGKEFEFQRDLNKIGKPVDKAEWDMTPPTVNAYYFAPLNEIVFPAGILQPPFFNPRADDAINYGGIGSVIGHEMTHGFDDQGAKFDGNGNLHNWWTPEDLKNFQARGECIVKQFSSYEVEPGLYGNGRLEEGESIADLGGITISHAAFEKTPEGKASAPSIDGFTPEQRFFLGFAQIWEENMRPEYARLIAKTNEHPLDQFRTNGALSNTPAFAKAFGCSADSKMVRPTAERCRIW
jgi:putative endopeptidase